MVDLERLKEAALSKGKTFSVFYVMEILPELLIEIETLRNKLVWADNVVDAAFKYNGSTRA